MGNHRSFYLSLVLLATLIVAAQAGAYYYFQRLNNVSPSRTAGPCNGVNSNPSTNTNPSRIALNVLISYGNSTSKWYNNTNIPADWNFYDLTLYVANCNVQAQFDSQLNEHYVIGLNGLRMQGQYSWAIWIYCQKGDAWVYSSVGADLVTLTNGKTLAWAYQSSSLQNSQPPVSGARTASSCP